MEDEKEKKIIEEVKLEEYKEEDNKEEDNKEEDNKEELKSEFDEKKVDIKEEETIKFVESEDPERNTTPSEFKEFPEEPEKKKVDSKTIIIGLLILELILSIYTSGFGLMGNETVETNLGLPMDEVEQIALGYIRTSMVAPNVTIIVDSIVKDDNLYKLTLIISNQTFVSYINKDATMIFPNGLSIE